ncbi:MAG: TonB-dependent receptor [Nibricoccus sp.]
MKKIASVLVTLCCVSGLLRAEESAVLLPSLTTYSARTANQDPVGTFAMPVSALRYEPLVDLQARNQGEAQADVTIRGGIFENTGFRIGGVSLYDPQTGHYFAEIPVASAMLKEPSVLTGTDNALLGFNANVGTVAYGWRPIATRGELSLGRGDHDFERGSFYQGYASPWKIAGRSLAADTEFSHSSGNGTIENGDHRFSRANTRVQLAGSEGSQTDLFAGYQEKFFGWPNLYTPFGVNETESLQSVLVALNHRESLGSGDFFEFGAFYRRNKDDYEYSREIPGRFNPYQHTTWARAVALSGRNDLGFFVLNYSGEILGDSLASTSLTFGKPNDHYKSRTYYKAGLVPEKSWTLDGMNQLVAKAGVSFDDTNRDSAAWSPLAELAWVRNNAKTCQSRVYISYAKTSQVTTYTALKSSPSSGLFRGNPYLGRQHAENIEVGGSHTHGHWSYRSAVFFRRDRALVDWTYLNASASARRANAVDIDAFGFEGVLSYTSARFTFVLGYTFLDKEADYRGALVDASFYALNYATNRLTAAVVARLGGGFEVRMDNVARVQEDNWLRRVGGDEALHSSLGLYYLPKAVAGLEISLTANNLWKSNYQEVPSVPAPGRQLSAGVTYRW